MIDNIRLCIYCRDVRKKCVTQCEQTVISHVFVRVSYIVQLLHSGRSKSKEIVVKVDRVFPSEREYRIRFKRLFYRRPKVSCLLFEIRSMGRQSQTNSLVGTLNLWYIYCAHINAIQNTHVVGFIINLSNVTFNL